MSHLSRRTLLASALAVGLAGCAKTPVSTGSSAAASDTATIGLSYIPNVQFAPAYVADARGLFTERGVKATLRHHGTVEGWFTALVAGQEDFVIAGGDEMVQAASQGSELVAIAQYYRQYPVVLIVPDASPIKAPADLAGHSVGVPGRYGESWFGTQVMLAGANLTEADVRIVEIGYTPLAALSSGKVEALVGFSNNDLVQFAQAKVPVRAIPLTSGAIPLVSAVLVTPRAYLDKRGAIAKKVADALVAGIDAVVKQPALAVTTSATYVPNSNATGWDSAASATLAATVPLWKTDAGTVSGHLDPKAWAAMTAFMRAQKLIAADVDPTKVMSNDYLTA